MEDVFWASKASFYNRLRKLYLPLLFIGVFGLITPVLFKSEAAQATPVNQATKVAYSGSYSSGNSSANTNPGSGLTTPSCSPDKAFQPAGPITVAAGQTGLVEQFDTPYAHKFYGYSAERLADLSRQCPLVVPGDAQPYINAYTSYWIGWRYDYISKADGSCRVSNPQVMLHINQALPVWQNSAQASPDLAAKWQSYTAAVKVHEDGHVQLIHQYSTRLLSGLQNFTAADCGSVETSVNKLGNDYLSQLKEADKNYEVSTQYGATQGAIVP